MMAMPGRGWPCVLVIGECHISSLSKSMRAKFLATQPYSQVGTEAVSEVRDVVYIYF